MRVLLTCLIIVFFGYANAEEIESDKNGFGFGISMTSHDAFSYGLNLYTPTVLEGKIRLGINSALSYYQKEDSDKTPAWEIGTSVDFVRNTGTIYPVFQIFGGYSVAKDESKNYTFLGFQPGIYADYGMVNFLIGLSVRYNFVKDGMMIGSTPVSGQIVMPVVKLETVF